MFDADGNELRTGDLVRVLFNARSQAEGESPVVRKVLAFSPGEVDMMSLTWEGGSQDWPADACRKVGRI